MNAVDPSGAGFWDTALHVYMTAESTMLAGGALAATVGVGYTCEIGSAGLATPVCAGITAEFAGVTAATGYVAVNEWKEWFD